MVVRTISCESTSSFVFVELGPGFTQTCMGGSEALLLGGGINHKYDASVPVYPLSSPPPCEKVKCQNGIRMCV